MEVKFSTRSAEQLKTPPVSMSGVVLGLYLAITCSAWNGKKEKAGIMRK